MKNPYWLPSRRRAFILGYQDGLEQPFDLTSGLTWEDNPALNEAYDHGVNAGQIAGGGTGGGVK